MNALDLFAGPGGWDEGVRPLGIEPLGIEWDEHACATRLAAGHPTLQADVSKLDPREFEAVLLLASPPCQAFSVAGKQRGNLDRGLILDVMDGLAYGPHDSRAVASALAHDARAMFVVEPLRFALALRPRFIAFEQVPLVLPLWEYMAAILDDAGYYTWTGKVYAEEYGIPQTRRRAILLASLDGPVGPPPSTHRRYDHRTPRDGGDAALLPWVSMADALGWDARGRFQERNSGPGARRTPRPLDASYTIRAQGSGSHPSGVQWVEAPTSADPRGLKGEDWPWRRPATTIAGDARVFQPGGHHAQGEQSRNAIRVSVQEAAALQTFPTDYPWQGPRSAQYLQVGNAVPPRLARAIVAELVGAAFNTESEAA